MSAVNLKCAICGKFLSYPTNEEIIGERLYDFDAAREDIYYHKICFENKQKQLKIKTNS